MDTDPFRPAPQAEAEVVFRWRMDKLERAGFTGEQALRLAMELPDVDRAIEMVGRGCSPRLAYDILT